MSHVITSPAEHRHSLGLYPGVEGGGGEDRGQGRSEGRMRGEKYLKGRIGSNAGVIEVINRGEGGELQVSEEGKEEEELSG